MRTTTDRLFVIRELSTGKLLKFGNKVAWVSSGAAKNAFNLHMYDWKTRSCRGVLECAGVFDNQNEYVIEEVN